MSTLPYRCRWVGCEHEQVEGALCITHATLLDRAREAEYHPHPKEEDQ